MPSRDGSWFGRQFYVFRPSHFSILGKSWKLLRAQSWFPRQFHVLKPFYSRPGSVLLWHPAICFLTILTGGSLFGRQFYVFKPFNVSMLEIFWKLLRAKIWFGQQFLGPAVAPGNSVYKLVDPKMEPQSCPIIVKILVQHLEPIFVDFWDNY